MQLKKIKLAGFKSFVDPTVLELNKPLVAVVGPNGCGKSNIIDAVRWVMGESSAKNLRGESMSDVIFNGSTGRKPVGQASIELVFDNSDGTLKGEYASYAEISIRRQATRDNQSSYFLNGTKCRRRDITDVFLGTGLGPRSYSIIEQGMISRVIEAKPEELRAFLEEAAGISVYRKRRQETETRMRHTRENLSRIEDLRQELDKQLERLKRQSEAAYRFRELKTESDTLEAELNVLRLKNHQANAEKYNIEIRRSNTELEEKMADRARVELELEEIREALLEANNSCQEVQTKFYNLGTEISRIEQSIEHHREREEGIEADLEEASLKADRLHSDYAEDKSKLQNFEEELQSLLPDLEKARKTHSELSGQLTEAETILKQWLENYEVFQSQAQKPASDAEIEKSKIASLDKQGKESHLRLDKLGNEAETFKLEAQTQELISLEKLFSEEEKTYQNTKRLLETLTLNLQTLRQNLEQGEAALEQLKKEYNSHATELASLKALQSAILGQDNELIQEWLNQTGNLKPPSLGQVLKVEPGYESALETVLGEVLEAVCVAGLGALTNHLGSFKQGSLFALEKGYAAASTLESGSLKRARATLLSSKLQSEYPVHGFLEGVYVTDTLAEALNLQSELDPLESVVTRDGVWLGKQWFRVARGANTHQGVLNREAEIKSLNVLCEELLSKISFEESRLKNLRAEISQQEKEKEAALSSQEMQSRTLQEVSNKIARQQSQLEQTKHRLAQIKAEIEEEKSKIKVAEQENSKARAALQQALDQMESFASKRTEMLSERNRLQAEIHTASLNVRTAQETLHNLNLKEQTLKTQVQAMEASLARLASQKQELETRIQVLRKNLSEGEAPKKALRDNLEVLLSKRLEVEADLREERQALESLEQKLRDLDEHRETSLKLIEEIRSKMETLKMEWQALNVRSETIQEKLAELKVDLEAAMANLASDANEEEWTAKLNQVNNKIQRLGAINLAAIEEFQTESERKQYLDSQYLDLTQALETLENAIRKIDKESRTRFQETFDKVNNEFKNLYPKLFGGGQAYLELVGEDLLEAGVSVMARPPGKRNSSIHLLSGGEKALTAVAFVFSIFQLNPAPFCMLDEVDAPLDDANVGRFCDLVKHMSQSVQFIYVTHNKLSMEIADHLVGVTMKEAGVSRLVSVDVGQAYELAES